MHLKEHYLYYLHGLIVEMAGIRPKSEEHGYYEYELKLDIGHGLIYKPCRRWIDPILQCLKIK